MAQLNLPKLRDPRHVLPLMTVDAARGSLSITEDEVRDLAERGAFWAWNIALDPAGPRPELRLLGKSVAAIEDPMALLDDQYALIDRLPTLTWSQVLALVLPHHDKPYFTGKEIKRSISCGRTHLIELVDAKLLQQLPGTTYRQGPNGCPLITRASAIQFLESRLC